MRFIYGTDFHGDTKKYNDIFNYADRNRIDIIHLGADLLPKGSNILENQKKFIKGFLSDWYLMCQKYSIKVLAMFGNDDIYTRKKYFTKDCGELLDENPFVTREGFTFFGFPLVPDYPFGLKTACRLDYRGWKLNEPYLGNPVTVDPKKGIVPIEDIDEFFKQPTIEEEIGKFHGGSKVIMSGHCPPSGIDLDVCSNGRKVGSGSIRRWIEKKKPLIFLAGHIHENRQMTDQYGYWLGTTLVIQPGQMPNETTMVDVSIDNGIIDHKLIT